MLLVQNERYKAEYCYVSWLARCFVMNGQPKNAWELYLKMDTSNESFNLLQLIANDCYRMGQFLYAAKAFDVLERLDPDPEFWEGKRGACVGVFQQVVAGKGAKEDLRDVLAMVRNTSNPQVEYMVRIISKWAASSRAEDHRRAGVNERVLRPAVGARVGSDSRPTPRCARSPRPFDETSRGAARACRARRGS